MTTMGFTKQKIAAKNCSSEEIVYMAKLVEQVEQYMELVAKRMVVEEFIVEGKNLSVDYKNPLISGRRNGTRDRSWFANFITLNCAFSPIATRECFSKVRQFHNRTSVLLSVNCSAADKGSNTAFNDLHSVASRVSRDRRSSSRV
ncbi:hypothetical protein CR513_41289, partial [Mucuna pruriens]